MNNVCTLARAPGGQMQGAATQARWRCCSLLPYNPVWLGLPAQFSSLAPRQRAWGPAAKCKRYSLTGPKEDDHHRAEQDEIDYGQAFAGAVQDTANGLSFLSEWLIDIGSFMLGAERH